MVFFNCNACGEAIKKNQVEKHYRQQCRNCQVLSCVDCGKEFWGDEYAKHIKCITEDEKFGGKAYKPKPNANKGEQKQELWVQQVQDAISKLKANPKLKDLLERLKDYPNIPRKQAKFENFLYNSLRVMNRSLVAQAWNSIAVEMSNSSTAEPPANVPAAPTHKKDGEKVAEIKTEVAMEIQNGHTLEKKKKKTKTKKRDKEQESDIANGNCKETLETDHPQRTVVDDVDAGKDGRKKMRKKRKRDEEEVVEEEEEETSVKKRSKCQDEKEEEKVEAKVEAEDSNIEEPSDEAPTGKFKWEAAIVGVLRRADDKEMTVKKLRKKVLGEFHARGGDGKHYTEERLLAKFTKKINKNRRLKVHKDTVKLVS